MSHITDITCVHYIIMELRVYNTYYSSIKAQGLFDYFRNYIKYTGLNIEFHLLIVVISTWYYFLYELLKLLRTKYPVPNALM